MEIPSPQGGVVGEIKVALGDKVNQGDMLMLLEVTPAEPEAAAASEPAEPPAEDRSSSAVEPPPETESSPPSAAVLLRR